MFSQFLSILKNLRGVVLFHPDDEVEGEVKWIVNKFRYRDVGVTPALLEKVGGEQIRARLSKKPFVSLPIPFPSIAQWISASVRYANIDPLVMESITLSSCFISPLLVLKRTLLKDMLPFVVWTLKSSTELNDQEIKRHLRIADYAVLDFYQTITQGAYNALERGDVQGLLEERKEKAKEDGQKRFWRLTAEGQVQPRELVMYLDPLIIFSLASPENRDPLLSIFSSNKEAVVLGLGMVVAFVLDI